jgi:hypothetical protein
VQGRIQAKDDTIALIRKEFVADLISAVTKNEKKELHFVFGGRDENDSSEDFVPVDGQQRLTALFLLHWFVFSKSGATEDERKKLKKFVYKSRETSRRFCTSLVDLLENEAITKIKKCRDITDAHGLQVISNVIQPYPLCLSSLRNLNLNSKFSLWLIGKKLNIGLSTSMTAPSRFCDLICKMSLAQIMKYAIYT